MRALEINKFSVIVAEAYLHNDYSSLLKQNNSQLGKRKLQNNKHNNYLHL